MFKKNANNMFNNKTFTSPIIANKTKFRESCGKAMHEQMIRLYEAAEKMKNVTGQSAVSRLLNASPQTVKNWEQRGISGDGMLDAQQIIGCSAVWIRSGYGPMVVGEPFTVKEATTGSLIADALKLTCETAQELQLLSVFRLANKDERDAITVAVENVRARLNDGIFRNLGQ